MTSHFPRHLRLHEVGQHKQELTHCCLTCYGVFSSVSILEAHKVSHLKTSPFICNLCPSEANISFDVGSKLQDHISTWHCLIPVETTSYDNDSVEDFSKEIKSEYDEDTREFDADDTM
jgi:uncharacterized Zn-finger protein